MLKLGFLFVAVFMTIVNVVKMVYKNQISAYNILAQAIGVTGFIYLQWIV